jgi:hypothetical protein
VKRAGVLLESREFPCDFFLWGHMKDLVYSIPIDLREPVGNAATIIRNNRGMLEFYRRLHYCSNNNGAGGPFEHSVSFSMVVMSLKVFIMLDS